MAKRWSPFPSLRLAVIGGALVAWALVIAWSGGRSAGRDRWLGVPSLGDLIVGFFLVAGLVGMMTLLLMLTRAPKTDHQLPKKRPAWPALILLAIVVFALSRLPRPEELPEAPEEQVGAEAADDEGLGVAAVNVLGAPELFALLAVIVVALAAIIWTRRRIALIEEARLADDDATVELDSVLQRLTERLATGDPRMAVIHAYADLEDEFAERGWTRGLAETPTEFVERVLASFPAVAKPVIDLAALYEVARFSERPVTVDDRRRASENLSRLSAKLRSTAAQPRGEPAAGPTDARDRAL